MANCSRARSVTRIIFPLGLVLLSGCSSRNHSSDVPSSNQTVVSGYMTVENSPGVKDRVTDLPLDRVENCSLDSDRLKAAFVSDRQNYRLELAVILRDEEWNDTECVQTSVNEEPKENEDGLIKYLGCYVTVMSNIARSPNAYDMHRRLPQMLGYTYKISDQVTCTIRSKTDLQTRIFEARSIDCKQMARTVANGRLANPIENDRSINLTAKDLRCSF